MDIQWYPGHMTKTKRMILESISLVDIVIELLDARIPLSSKNPDIDGFARDKHRIIILNKSDLANPVETEKWSRYFKDKGFTVVLVDSITGKGLSEIPSISAELMREKVERLKKRGRIFVPTRAMIVGIPNVGKSTLINKFAGKASAKTGDKPGVTRGKQWIKIKKDFDLLDTPGILWPKFEDVEVGYKLAFTGAIKDDIMDRVTLATKLIELLVTIEPSCLPTRYKIELTDTEKSYETLEKIAKARGFMLKGGESDFERAAITVLDEFRGCKLGRITLESPME